MNTSHRQRRVLIVTGGFLSVKDRSLFTALRKQVRAVRASSAAWYDLNLKAVAAEQLLPLRRHLASRRCRRASYGEAAARFFADGRLFDTPELSEVTLATLLEAEGIAWEASTYAELFADPTLRERLLRRCGCVFCCTTLLRDISELAPMVAALKRPDNRVVAGGALASLTGRPWRGGAALDLLAVGHGEPLIPAIAAWIRSGFTELRPPSGGRLEPHAGVPVLYSGAPAARDLDALPTPDWALAERYHGRAFPLVHYESVRGCPFRCSFCSYPFLFDDHLPRYKSAARIAQEWTAYAERGARFINCLDSTFTAPRKRLTELCERLIALGSPVRWLCYGRGSELEDPALCRLMARAGCHQVQIGVESGSPEMLTRMNKRCTVAQNRRALAACHEAGIGTLVTVIIGFPGETPQTVRQTYRFIQESEPDFAYACPFVTRVAALPVLEEAARARFGLRSVGGSRSSSPYWRHASMSCDEVGRWQRWFTRKMMLERAALDGTLFYQGIVDYCRQRDRSMLLDLQRDAALSSPLLRAMLTVISGWTNQRLRRDMAQAFAEEVTTES